MGREERALVSRYEVPLLLSGVVLVVLLVFNGAIFTTNLRALDGQGRAIVRSQRVFLAITGTGVYLLDATLAMQSYALSGEARYLPTYDKARGQIKNQLTQLTTLTADNPAQQVRVAQVRRLIAVELTTLARSEVLRRDADSVGARRLVLSPASQQRIDAIRTTLSTMLTAQVSIYLVQGKATATAMREAVLTLILATGLSVLLLVGFLALLVRHLRQRSRRLAHELAARQAAEAAVAARDTFLSLGAHELKTPLTVLSGAIQLLQRRFERHPDLEERDRHLIALLGTSTERLTRLADDLLDVSRLQRGELTLHRIAFDLEALLEQVVEAVQLTTAKHTITLERPPALCLVGDDMRLEQVLRNLLQNAIKYSPHGGTVRVRLSEHDGRAHITVSDDGIGIPASALPHLFDRFFRAENANLPTYDGLGLGLYVTKQIVIAHGGTIRVESVEGSGSTFTITLPLTQPVTQHATTGRRPSDRQPAAPGEMSRR